MARKRPHKGNNRRGSTKGPRKQRRTITGTLRVLRPGSAVVETPEGTFEVTRSGIREAMSGDEVSVFLVGPRDGRGGGGRSGAHGNGRGAAGGEKRAVVDSVVTRANHTLLGRFELAGPLGAVVPLDNRLCHDFFVVPEDKSPERLGVAPGDVVVARIVEYPTPYTAAVVTIDRRVGSASELDMNIESVIASHGLACEFSPATLAQAEGVSAGVGDVLAADPHRADLRDVMCMTIDPADARDFDDAVGARKRADGGFDLDVHIADVTHYLPWGSSMDLEARSRTCSVYLVDRVIPMLPERLSNDVCSLRPGEDRLAMTVRMRLDAQGAVVSAKACAAAIRSNARLCYDEVDELLSGAIAPADLPCVDASEADAVAEMLRVLDRIRDLRERARRARGAIDFETREAKVVLDDEGHPTGVSVRNRTRATGLVEEAMLLANESVARILADSEVPAAYRVHEQPSAEDLRHTVAPLDELGVLGRGAHGWRARGDPARPRRGPWDPRGVPGERAPSSRAAPRRLPASEPRPLRPRRHGLLPLHLADSPLPR